MAEILSFTDAQRTRIRAGLNRYKAQHDIGVPTLFEHMKFELGLNCEIHLRALQNFLKGTRRTDDTTVRKYERFLDIVAPPPPYEIMGDAIVTFFDREPPLPKARKKHNETVHAMFARRYRCYLKGERTKFSDKQPFDDPNWPIPEVDLLDPVFEIPYSILEFEPLESTSFVKVTEYVVNPVRSSYWGEMSSIGQKLSTESDVHHIGVLSICVSPQLYVITLRQDASHFPKFYLLFDTDRKTINPNSAILGSCLSVSEDFNSSNLTETFEVKLFSRRIMEPVSSH